MTELDKFKRRMIRAVARLLQEKKPEDELWEQMKKETGCDCRLLWERMRALTLKKLRRLLLSDDKSENVASIARMSLTDWLLFDLVLVHEKTDFIEKELLESNKEMKPLVELFYLVQKFQIESVRSNALADAWTAATVIYNSRGHQCSPMLLQKRWYQLKEATREKFYAFWFKYRGNAKQLSGAEQFKPSRLQAAIAKRYNDLIIKPFSEWDKMIEDRLVILPDEFESKMRDINFTMPIDNPDDGPELILVEPIIETIDLGEDSDSDQQEQTPPTESVEEMLPLIKIKTEPKDTALNDDNNACDAEMLRAMNKQLPQKVLDATSIEEKALLESENETLKTVVNKNIITDTVDIVVHAASDDISETSEVTNSNEVIMPQISNVFGNVTNESLSLITAQAGNEVVNETSYDNTEIELKTECLNNLDDSYPVEDDTNNESKDSELKKLLLDPEQIVSNDTDKNNLEPLIINSSDDDIREEDGHLNEVMYQTENTNINHDTVMESENDKISVGHLEYEVEGTDQHTSSLLSPDTTSDVKVKVEDIIHLDEDISEPQIKSDNNFTKHIVTEHSEKVVNLDNIQEVENLDNIEEVENLDNIEDDIICIRSEDTVSKPSEIHDTAVKVEDFPVDINFADDGIEFVDDGIEFFDEDSNSNTDAENNVENLPIKSEPDDQLEKKDEQTPKFDLKLLLNPIVYTKKLDDLSIFNDNDFDVKSKDLIDYIEKECKPLCVMSNDVTNIKQEIQDAIATSANDDFLNNNDSSEESDFEDIPESYKVKTSSYLLQKPKSRTYNPIQLCKNPDFNTRLKRLPVGFFSSTRNCQLLKCCKPMTIDVNKTFENKLINGTIYLKPNIINDSVVNIVDEEKDFESKQTVSVFPSAMAAQSLIDNTIALPATKQTNILKHSYTRQILTNTPNIDTLISERSRVINLPDISQIRRINQKLLTAEVTPIRVQNANNAGNTAVQLVTDHDSNEANTLGVQRIQPNVSEVISVSDKPVIDVPDKPVINVPDKPGTNVPDKPAIPVSDKPASVFVEVDKKPVMIPAQNQTIIPSNTTSSKASKINDFIKQIEATGSEIAKVDPKPDDITSCLVNDKTTREKNLKQKTTNKYKRTYHPEVSWLTVKRHPIVKNDDSLLTLDTLNKMLDVINGDVVVNNAGQFQINKKKKKKASRMLQGKVSDSKIEGPPSKSKKTDTVMSKDEHIIEKMRKRRKPKIKIISRNRLDDSTTTKNQDNWCCKSLSENQEKQNAACVVLSDDEDNTALHNACESIERVVRQTHELDAKTKSVSIVQSNILNTEAQSTPVEVIGTPLDVIETLVEAIENPAIEIEIPAEGVETLDIQSENRLAPSITNIKTNVVSGVDVATVVETTVSPALCGSTMLVRDKKDLVKPMQPTPLKHTVNIPFPDQSTEIRTQRFKRKFISKQRTVKRVLPESYYRSMPDEGAGSTKRDSNILYKYQAMPCSCRSPSVSLDTPKRHIVIDGSTSCAAHNQTSTNIKHKVLLMNSKNISREPSERPISLGKNKILLTTVKLPKYTQPSPDILQNAQVIPAMPLPFGVQLILLPNGELTYFIEPGVQLTTEQMSSIPIILAAVKQQLDSCSVPSTPKADAVDIVNISDDEGTPSIKDTINKPHTIDENNLEVENISNTMTEEFINKQNKSAISDSIESPQPIVQQEKSSIDSTVNKINDNLNIHANKEENNVENTLDVNINNKGNDMDHEINENVSKITVGTDDIYRNGSKETNNVDNNLNENISKEKTNICDPIENDNKENNIVGDKSKKNNEEMNEVGDDRNKDVKEHKSSESDTNSAAPRKTILSDLMEMSGISAEDTVSMSQENVVSENTEGKITDNVMISNLLQPSIMPPLIPLNNIIHETDIETDNIPELTPITSLSELKYACDQEDGQFFKLDLDTGVLIPINVCIKKHTKHSSDTSGLFKPIAPKQVMIDLTDDNDIIVQENQSSKPMMYNNLLSRNNYKSLLKSSRGDGSVKPVKIFKSVHANILRRRYRNNLKESKVCLELDKQRGRKRKQRLSQIEAKIDLVDSDAPMEEEYLMDSFDDSVDSSDDEPLASIAKRKRAELTDTTANECDQIDGKHDKSEVRMDITDVPPDRPEDANKNNDAAADITQALTRTEVPSAVTQAPSDVTETATTNIVSEIGPSQVPCEDDVDEPPQISFFSDDNCDSDVSEENCILGV